MSKPQAEIAEFLIHTMARNIDGTGRALADHVGIILDLHRLQFSPQQIDLYIYRAIDKARDMRRARGAQSVGSLAARIVGRV